MSTPDASAGPPLPVAALLRRARNAKSPKERHDTAYHAWEASLRIAAAARLGAGASQGIRLRAPARGEETPPRPLRLKAPSAGDWARAAALDDRRPLDEPALLDAHALFRELGRDEAGRAASVTARSLAEPLAEYRNRVIGHGAVREADLYDRAAATLARGLGAAWQASVFAPGGAFLAYLESIEIDERGERRARLIDLSGAGPVLVDGLGQGGVPADALPRRVYLAARGEGAGAGAGDAAGAGGGPRMWSLTSLHPFVVYDDGELRERCLFYNGRRRGAELLDFVSGECLRGKALEGAFPGLDREIGRAIEALEERGLGEGEAAGEGPGARQEAEVAGGGAAAGGAAAAAPGAAATAGPEGARLGDFAILGRLGAGGMGVVYLARQESLGRLVALKTLPPDIAGDETTRSRFEREVRALSRCDHPNVVKILSSGHDEATGAPYYAMEYVEGADLADVARELRSSGDVDGAISSASEKRRAERRELFAGVPDVRRRADPGPRSKDRFRRLAALFRDIARGVEHLHQSGVLHRDLKPSNLMVASADGRPVVMDLGLAAVAGATRALTRTGGGLLGTLRYMPPEQVRRGLLELDGRADVYALGASLHELVVGRPLFDGDSETRLLEQVLNEEPVAADRIDRAVPRDLALIIRKAVEKDRRRRYETAADLAQDLDAFLEGRAIAARPPTLGYVLRLAVARHKVLAAAVGGALFVLVDAVILFVLGLSEARETEARLRVRADASRARAQALLDFMLFDLRDRLKKIGRLELLGEVATRAQRYYEGLEARGRLAEEDAESYVTALLNVADVLENRGRASDAIPLLTRALAIAEARRGGRPLDPGWVDCVARTRVRHGLALYALGRTAESRVALSLAALESEQAVALDPARRTSLTTAAWAQLELAGALQSLELDAEAARTFERSRELWRSLLPQPGPSSATGTAAATTATATPAVTAAPEGGPGRPDAKELDLELEARGGVAECEQGLGRLLETRGERALAKARYEVALAMRREIAAREPDGPAHRSALGVALRDMSRALLAGGDADGALRLATEAVAESEAVSARDPENARWRGGVALAKLDLAAAIIDADGHDAAEGVCREALALARGIAAADAANDEAARTVSLVLTTLGDILSWKKRPDDARAAHAESLAISERLLAAAPGNPRLRNDADVARGRLADFELEGGRPAETVRLLRPMLVAAREKRALDPTNGQRARDLAVTLEKLGRAEEANGAPDAAADRFREAISIVETLAASDAGRALLLRDLSTLYEDLASALLAKEDFAGALAAEERALDVDRRLSEMLASDLDQRFVVALRHEQVAAIQERLGRLEGALASREASGEILDAIDRRLRAARGEGGPVRRLFAAQSLEMMRAGGESSRAALLVSLDRAAEAVALARRALARVEDAPAEARKDAPRALAAVILAEACVAAGDLPAAASATAIGLRSSRPDGRARAVATRALVLEARGAHEAALADAAAAAKEDPDLALPWLVRAQVHAARGARAEAEEALRQYRARAPGDRRADAVQRRAAGGKPPAGGGP